MEEDILRLKAQTLAYGLVLRCLIRLMWNGDDRAAIRDHCCETVEQMYAEMNVGPHGHVQLQAVMHDVEELFRTSEDDSAATPNH